MKCKNSGCHNNQAHMLCKPEIDFFLLQLTIHDKYPNKKINQAQKSHFLFLSQSHDDM